MGEKAKDQHPPAAPFRKNSYIGQGQNQSLAIVSDSDMIKN
jgi:hypothetical protein